MLTGIRTGMEEAGNFRLRVAKKEDAQALRAIYAPYVEQTAITFEWKVPSEEEFAGRIEHTLQRYPYIVVCEGDEPVGYAYAGPFYERAAYDWAVETSIYVRQDKRGLGLGKMLLNALERRLAAQHILNVNACIAWPKGGQADEHLTCDSVHFHEHMGYRNVGEFDQCGFKFGRWYNVIWMEKHIGPHTENPLPVIPFAKGRCLMPDM